MGNINAFARFLIQVNRLLADASDKLKTIGIEHAFLNELTQL